MNKKEIYLNRIKDVSELLDEQDKASIDTLNQVYFSTLAVLENLYGSNDARCLTLSKFKSEYFDKSPFDHGKMHFKSVLHGILNSIKKDIEDDLMFNIEKQTIGSVVGDFVTLAKISSEQGNKDVAAILASAALEDALKRYAALNGMQVNEEEMSEIINCLKSKGLVKGPQASVLTSYVLTRNKAFHAEFSKIEMPEVKSLIAFTEEFILKNLS